jgi:hypothetical protein
VDQGSRVDMFVYDTATGTTTNLTESMVSNVLVAMDGDISADGSTVVMIASSNPNVDPIDGESHLYRWHQGGFEPELLDLDETGTPVGVIDFELTDNGRYLTWGDSDAVFVRDLQTAVTDNIMPELGAAGGPTVAKAPSVSEDGRYVGIEDGEFVYRFDRASGQLDTVSVSNAGVAFGGRIGQVSGDGRFVTWTTEGTPTPDDANPGADVFVRDLDTDRTSLVSSNLLLGPWDGEVVEWRRTALSRDGRYAAFIADGRRLVDSEGPGLYVRSTAFITVDSATPTSLPDGATTMVTVTGTGFRPDTQWGLSADDRSRWTILSSTTIDDDTATMTIKVTAGATPGPINIVAINPGNPWGPYTGAANWCLGCLTIT